MQWPWFFFKITLSVVLVLRAATFSMKYTSTIHGMYITTLSIKKLSLKKHKEHILYHLGTSYSFLLCLWNCIQYKRQIPINPRIKKSRIREMRIVAPIPKKSCGNFTPFMSKSIQIWDHFLPLVFPKDSENLKSLDIGLLEVGATKRLNGVNRGGKIRKKLFFCCGYFRPFCNKNVHIWDRFFLLLFPRDSESLKIWDIQFREVGAKRRLNSTSKVSKFKLKKKKNFFRRGDFRPFKKKKTKTTSFHFFSPRIPNL